MMKTCVFRYVAISRLGCGVKYRLLEETRMGRRLHYQKHVCVVTTDTLEEGPARVKGVASGDGVGAFLLILSMLLIFFVLKNTQFYYFL